MRRKTEKISSDIPLTELVNFRFVKIEPDKTPESKPTAEPTRVITNSLSKEGIYLKNYMKQLAAIEEFIFSLKSSPKKTCWLTKLDEHKRSVLNGDFKINL